MKWFQHNTDSYNDPDISDAEDIFGDAGYAVFFKILEIYGREFNSIDSDGFLKISLTFVRRKLRKSSTKVQQILNFYQTKKRISFKTDGDDLLIKVPKFLKKSSNWTKRTTLKKDGKLCSSSVVTQAREVEEEIEVEKKKSKYSIGFESFWSIYPRKIAKHKAYSAWKNHTKNVKVAAIIDSLKSQIQSEAWQKENGMYIPHPTSWINGRRWEDEVGKVNQRPSVRNTMDPELQREIQAYTKQIGG